MSDIEFERRMNDQFAKNLFFFLNKDEVKNNYHKSILKLLWMLRNSSKKLLGNVANFDEIKHSIELAEYYFNKIPFKDALKMPKLWQVVSEFKKISNTLKKKV